MTDFDPQAAADNVAAAIDRLQQEAVAAINRAAALDATLRQALDTMRAMFEAATGEAWVDQTGEELVAAMRSVNLQLVACRTERSATFNVVMTLENERDQARAQLEATTAALHQQMEARIAAEAALAIRQRPELL